MKASASAAAQRLASRVAGGHAQPCALRGTSFGAGRNEASAMTLQDTMPGQTIPAGQRRNASSLSMFDPLHLALLSHQDLPPAAAEHHAAMREAMGRSDHAQVAASALGLVDEGFRQGNLKLIDLAHVELNVFHAKTSAPSARALLDHAKTAAQVMGSGSMNSLCLSAERSLPRGIVSGEISSMSDLASYFPLSDQLVELPNDLQGRCNLNPDECLALSLYSGRQRGLGSTFFMTINTVMRTDLPVAKQRLDFLLSPLMSGMKKLPALPNAELRRGLLVGDGGVRGMTGAKAEYRLDSSIQFSAPSVGSLVAAYPGNVVLQMVSTSNDTQLRDSSAFHGYPAAREGSYLPGAQFKVARCEVIKVPKEWMAADETVGYCGRLWRHRVGQPVLVVRLKETPADSAA